MPAEARILWSPPSSATAARARPTTSRRAASTALLVLRSVFSVADTRRRQTYRRGTCGHTWHNLPPSVEKL
ncbi:DUF5958 family protein [Streptomyces sp. NBC_01237]|uniref:DUF5958 family protein n=1 Tax=Streptomyces sp. NBC_01237 TaxID=2903790 RepID=UPI002DD946B0|nr:DUF5958 family protein [Streptomyces sp. NBC_01237]WRZ78487.1 DUF5958 family protein [Streptomyces sp. NBC_01237]